MSKTNHRRGFQDKKLAHGQRTGGYITFQGHRTTMDGQPINAFATVASEIREIMGLRREQAP